MTAKRKKKWAVYACELYAKEVEFFETWEEANEFSKKVHPSGRIYVLRQVKESL